MTECRGRFGHRGTYRRLESHGRADRRRLLAAAPGQSTPECWTAICPHAGCFVDFDKKSNKFKCPCHNSSFTVEGQIIQPSPSPRPMDSLECKVEDDEILVQYESFYSGITEKRAKA